jgi:6-phosphogluconolactonase (cycloisomerase 2 family)
MRTKKRTVETAILAVAVIAIVGILPAAFPEWGAARITGSARLVSIREFPKEEICTWESPAGGYSEVGSQEAVLMASLQPAALFGALQQRRGGAGPEAPQQRNGGRRFTLPPAINEINRPPVFRTIADSYPIYTAVGVNLQTDEVILQDNNLWSTRVFNRLDNTPAAAKLTEEKRVISGDKTEIQFNNGVYIDPNNGDIYSVESDTGDKMVVFARDARGDVVPKRILATPHRVYSIAVDEVKKELYVTVEYPPEVVVYRKEATGDEMPLRRIQGDRTHLEAPHGIAVDVKNQLLFVNNWGAATSFRNPGTGKFNPPSINVYALGASGDTAPLRVIQGNRTQMNWPGNMTLHPDTGELYIANDVGQSILVFGGLTYVRGNVPPKRVIKGDKTALNYPTGVFVDTKHQEVWVSNLGNASAAAYPLMANGNVAPLRIVRSAPLGHVSLTFGRTAAVAYDSNREEILVPN